MAIPRTMLVYDPKYTHRRRFISLDPDPFIISWGVVAMVVIICGAIGGVSMAWQNPSFFDRIIAMFNPAYKEMKDEDRAKEKEFWRIVLGIVVVIGIVALAFIWYRYSKQKSYEKMMMEKLAK